MRLWLVQQSAVSYSDPGWLWATRERGPAILVILEDLPFLLSTSTKEEVIQKEREKPGVLVMESRDESLPPNPPTQSTHFNHEALSSLSKWYAHW